MAYTFLSQFDDFTIVKSPGRTVRHIIKRHHDSSLTMSNLRFGRSLKPLVHRTAFVRFHMTERDPPQLRDRNNF